MKNQSSQQFTERTAFDDWRSISLSLFMTLVGYGVMVAIPVISTAWSELLFFSEEQVGRVAGADLGGLSFGAMITALTIARVNRKILVLTGACLAIFANYLCTIFYQYEFVLWLRVLSGIGSGIFTAVAVAALGATIKPTRAFNLMLFLFAFSQAFEIRVLPTLTMNGIYYFFIGGFTLSLIFIHWVQPYAIKTETTSQNKNKQSGLVLPLYIPWLCMAAIFFTYINIGAYWTYIELASLNAGIDKNWVGGVLVWSSLLSIVGCAFATIISDLFGLARPLLVALITMAIIVGMLALGITNINLLISVFMFNFLWIFIDVYQYSTIASVDSAGSFTAFIVCAQGLGNIVGPNIAASMLGGGFSYSTVFFMCAMFAIGGMLVYMIMDIRLRYYRDTVY